MGPKNNFTYFSEPIKNKIQKSKIDLIIFADPSFPSLFFNPKFLIFIDQKNHSDHIAINLLFYMDHFLVKNMSASNHEPVKPLHDRKDPRTWNFLISQVETHLKDFFLLEIFSNFIVKNIKKSMIFMQDLQASTIKPKVNRLKSKKEPATLQTSDWRINPKIKENSGGLHVN